MEHDVHPLNRLTFAYNVPTLLVFFSQRPKRRLYRLVDKITKSSYFQRAVDSKLVQRGMEYVSSRAINLQLEVIYHLKL